MNKYEYNLINQLGLTKIEVVEIVRLWYTNGMYGPILQTEAGEDLEEVCEEEIDALGNNVYDEKNGRARFFNRPPIPHHVSGL
jgi:hypothetical protein